MPHECTNCGHTFPDGSKEMLSGCPDCGGNKFQFAPNATASTADQESTASATSDRESSVASDRESSSNTQSTPDSVETTGFDEWPDSARRPENRSSADNTNSSPASRSESAPRSDASGSSGTTSSQSHTSSSSPDSTAPDTASSTAPEQPNTTPSRSTVTSEDTAQASARTDVVSDDELPSGTADGDQSATTAGSQSSIGGETPPEDGRVVSEPTEEQPSIDELRAELNEQFESIKILSPGQYELNLMELYNREEHIISLQEDGRYVIDVPDSWHNTDAD